MNPEKSNRLLNVSVSEKIEYSIRIIKEALERFPDDMLYIALTGGKDSLLMLWLYREVCMDIGKPLPKTMFIDEGNVFEEILEFMEFLKKEWQVEVAVVKNKNVSDKASAIGDLVRVADLNERNRKEIEKLGFTEDAFPFEPESLVGNHLMKTVAMNLFLEKKHIKALSTGIRWDEQEARGDETFFSPRTNPDHIRVHPILHFKERDVWDTIQLNGIPFCSLYNHGYRSLGAKGSTVKDSDIPAWDQDLENTSERSGRGQDKEGVMSQLRALGYM